MERKEILFELYAKAYLLDETDKKLDFIETVPETQQYSIREHLRKMGEDIFRTAIETDAPNQDYRVRWSGLVIMVDFYAPLDCNLSISNLVSFLNKTTGDTHLEDERIYEDYIIAFDDFKIIVNRRKNLAEMKVEKFQNYWQWKKEPVKTKSWDMWATKEGKDSISIRHNTNPIPCGEEIVTVEKTIYFDWSDSPIIIFSRDGFSVEDIIMAVSDIISQDYEKKFGEELDRYGDDEIGSIDVLTYNPVTRHVSINVTFD